MRNFDHLHYKRIITDCFWDSNIEAKDIDAMLNSEDIRTENYLFEKILINSTNLLTDLKLFNRDELKIIMEKYKIPSFNHEYIFRRKNIADVYFFDKPLLIDELKWMV